MERSRLTRSTAPESRKSGAPTSRLGAAVFAVGFQSLSSESVGAILPQTHENDVDGHAMQPGGKGRFAAERADLAEQLKESLLHRSSASAGFPNHPQAGHTPCAMSWYKKLKSSCVPRLSQTIASDSVNATVVLVFERANCPVAARPIVRMRRVAPKVSLG